MKVIHKIALGVEYNGAGYLGFQRQKDSNTIQSALESAISCVANETIQLVCAGRTDRGVHACGQVIHFETITTRTDLAWVLGVNAHLPNDIKILWKQSVPEHFNARKSAHFREYLYVIYNNRVAPGLFSDRLTWVAKPLDIAKMQAAARFLEGEHDFSAFRASGCQAVSPVRTIHHIKITQKQDYIFIRIKANAFLQNMVRNIVGTLLPIGLNERPISGIQDVLASCDRKQGGVTAKPNGLYFMEVGYPQEYNLPEGNQSSFWSIVV